MRELLFKAKAINESTFRKVGDWCEGYYVYNVVEDKHSIINKGFPQIMFQVDADTVSQYTNCNNKHGDRIWEHERYSLILTRYEDYDDWEGEEYTATGYIEFSEGTFQWVEEDGTNVIPLYTIYNDLELIKD